MAKRKDAIALFEVITATKRKELEAEQRLSLGTSRWWFKRKGNGDSSQDVDPTSPSYVAAPPPSAYAPEPASSPAAAAAGNPPAEYDPTLAPPAGPMVGQVAVITPETTRIAPETTRPVPVIVPAPVYQSAAVAVAALPVANGSPIRNWRDPFRLGIEKVGLDPGKQEVTVRFRYSTAILAGFALLIALGLAFVMGRRSSPAIGSNSPSTKDVRDGPVLVNVLNPDDGQIATLDIPAETPRTARKAVPTRSAQGGGRGGAAAAGRKQEAPDKWAGADIESGLPRVIGMNYVLVQSYAERKDADAARDALVAAGIPATVERVPKSWAPNSKMFSVIGTHGFRRPKTSAKFREYKEAIAIVSKAFAGRSRYLAFDPNARAYQWKKEDEDAKRKAATAAAR